jgi:hypothetical protein
MQLYCGPYVRLCDVCNQMKYVAVCDGVLHALPRTSLADTQHHTDGHMDQNTTVDNIFYVTNDKNESRHYILLPNQQ